MRRGRASASRLPFTQVVTQLCKDIPSKEQQRNFQRTSTGVEQVEDSRSLEDLTEDISLIKTVEEKFIYACKHGSDTVSHEILTILLETVTTKDGTPVQLQKIIDRQANNCSLMHLCAQRNKFRCMELLNTFNCPIDSVDTLQATPLLYAVAQNCTEAATFLLSKNANVNIKDVYNKFPVLVALKNKHYRMAELLATGTNIDIHQRTTKGSTVLHIMALEGDLTAVKFLVEKCNASPLRRNNDEENVLFTGLPFVPVAEYLSQRFAADGLSKMLTHETSEKRTIFHETIINGNYNSLQMILKHAKINELSIKQIQQLLNSEDKYEDTPLLLAAKNGHKDMVKFLCMCEEVDLNAGDSEGNTALYYAMQLKDPEIISLLSTVGASLKADSDTDTSHIGHNKVLSCLMSLNTMLVLLLSLITVLCIVVIAAISIGFFVANAKVNAMKIRRQSAESVMDYLKNTLATHTTMARTGFSIVFEQGFNIETGTLMAGVGLSVMKVGFRASSISDSFYCGLPTGQLAGSVKDANSTTLYTFNSYDDPYQLNYTVLAGYNTAAVAKRFNIRYDYAHWDGPALQTSKNTTSLGGWSVSYVKANEVADRLSISFVRQLIVKKKFAGYCGADSSIESLGKFLSNSGSKLNDGNTIIIERSSGYLLATSDPSVPIYSKAQDGTVTRYSDVVSGNDNMAAMLKYVKSMYGGHYLSKVNTTLMYSDFRLNGVRYALSIGRAQDGLGVDWVVIQSIPWSIFFSKLNTNIYTLIGVTVALLILSVFVSAFAAHMFMRPVKRLVTQANLIKLLQLEKVEKELNSSLSMYSEIRSVREAFLSMVKRLKQFRSFIPEHILAILDSEVPDVKAEKSEKQDQEHTGDSSERLSVHDLDSVRGTTATSTSSIVQMKGLVSNAFNLGLTSGEVTIMTVEFEDLDKLFEVYSSPEIQEVTKDILTILQNCVRASKGQSVNVTAKRATIAWNSFIPQNDHKARGCRTARHLMDSIKKYHDRWHKKKLPIIGVTVGLCSGTVRFGNLTSDKLKFFTVIGYAHKWSENLAQMNHEYNTSIICCESIMEYAREEYYSRPLSEIETDNNSGGRLRVYELGESKEKDNWVNEMEDKVNGNHKWTAYCNAYEYYISGDLTEAIVQFIKVSNDSPHDIPTQRMVDTCNDQLKKL
jgi:ankyrin repeat protein/class 3 adenylate cyclase